MPDYPYYHWKHEPDDGEYELQFDRFETSEGGDPLDLVVLLIVDDEEGVGEVHYPTADVPGINRDDTVRTAIFHGTIRDSEIVDMTYDTDLTEQGIKEATELHNRVRGNADDETDTER